MDATDLARWTRFAAKGGIGKCTALQDRAAQGVEDLMFLKDDEVVVLLQLPQEDQYLGYCEGVVGRFHGSAVRFHGKLKKPVFAKRQSSIGASPSRPISLSPRAPSTYSPESANLLGSKHVTPLTMSPRAPSLPIASTSDVIMPAKVQPSQFSATVPSPAAIPPQPSTSHTLNRNPSAASSASHYSTLSRSHSQSQARESVPVSVPAHAHARKASTASSRSAYSSASNPPSRAHSRSNSGSVYGSEDTHTQHVSMPPPAVPTSLQATPALTDGSSAHSSFLLSPVPAISSPFSPGAGKVTASLFQGRARSGSEKLSPRTESAEGRRRSGSENSVVQARPTLEEEWGRGDRPEEQTMPGVLVEEQEKNQGSIRVDDESKGISHSGTSGGERGTERRQIEHLNDGGEGSARLSIQGRGFRRSIVNEDQSDEDGLDGRTSAASNLSDLSDGGFGIGMTLLREDEDDNDSETDEQDEDREDEETAIGHASATESEKLSVRRPRTVGMRVMNPSSVSPSGSESESDRGEDQTVMPTTVQSHPQATPTLASSATPPPVPAVPAAALPTRPPLPTYPSSSSTIDSRRTSSIAQTEDEHWESDADIYDDYRYSRYSSHYSGSPAQLNSKRTSKASTKSGRSRASERPPLPDEEWWKKSATGANGVEEGVPRKSLGSERSSFGKRSTGTSADLKLPPVTRLSQAPVSPTTMSFTRGGEPSTSATRSSDATENMSGERSRTPPPGLTNAIAPATPGAASAGNMSLTSPLTRAFRASDVSEYSRASVDDDEDEEENRREERRTETPLLTAQRHPSPGPEPRSPERNQRASSRSPALASSIREKIENERRVQSPHPGAQPQLSILTTRMEDEPNVIVLNDSPSSEETSGSPSLSSPNGAYLRLASPGSYTGSAPPSPLNPGFPPSPSSMASFAPTAPLSISKTPSPSPSAPRQPISPPAIPFTGVPPPGRPPAHMQHPQRPIHSPPPTHQQQQHTVLPPSDSLHSALRMAGQQRANTIHGLTQTDLLTATGPVPISFLLPGMMPSTQSPAGSQPLPRPQLAAPQIPYGQFPPQTQDQLQSLVLESPPRSMSPSHQPQTVGSNHEARPGVRRPMTAPAPAPGSSSALRVDLPSPSNTSSATARTNSFQVTQPGARNAMTPPLGSAASAAPIPRANFFPAVSQARPRSRSFSGFNSEITKKVSQSLGRRSQDEGNNSLPISNNGSRPGSPSSKPPTQSQPSSPVMGPARGKGQAPRPSHGPSPLSLPPTTNSNHPPAPKSPLTSRSTASASPIARITPSSVRSLDIADTQPKRGTLRQASSHATLRSGPQAAGTAASSVVLPPQRHNSGPAGPGQAYEDVSLRPPSPLKSPMARQSHDSDRTHSSFARSERTSPPPFSNISPSASPMARSGSLRSKISMSALRGKGGSRSIREGAPETASGPPTPPADEETVQVKDLEFELVRPVIPRISSDSHRGEANPDSKELVPIRTTDIRNESSSVRSEALSPGGLSPSSDLRLHGAASADSSGSSRKGKGADMINSVQAHRDRELKWISTMNSNDAAQAKKSKKIKKLLIDGVPSSVRYLVWAHLSNSGSKKMPNVYAQLCKRRPAFARDIERDVEQSFPDHHHLRDPEGPLVSVLFAYIAMVPDLRYHRGLAIIAGHLLLQSPEEDAFWTFLAMMDSHLRPYFMPTSAQMGIDTTLFVKVVEAADAQLAKRLFAELNVRPQELCRVWFSSVFAGTLPLEHLHRVWDIFFYEGVPFLFRVALTILSLSRRYLLEFSKGSPASYTAYLLRPPPEALPADPEQFISQALSVKLKDDDIRKSRLKMEASVVKQQQRTPRISTSQPIHPHFQGERVRAS